MRVFVFALSCFRIAMVLFYKLLWIILYSHVVVLWGLITGD